MESLAIIKGSVKRTVFIFILTIIAAIGVVTSMMLYATRHSAEDVADQQLQWQLQGMVVGSDVSDFRPH